MTLANRQLDFELLDDICLAVANGKLVPSKIPIVEASTLGPFLEAYHLHSQLSDTPSVRFHWLEAGPLRDVLAMQSSKTRAPRVGDQSGWIEDVQCSQDGEWNAFLMRAKRAAVDAGFLDGAAAKFIAAIDEFRANISEHSCKPQSGYVAFQASKNAFEFVVADKGIGVLESLRMKPDYASLDDAGVALGLAMTDGVSRFDSSTGRGFGFRPVVVGLANIARLVRIRSGDHSRELHRHEDGKISASTAERVPIEGLFCSVLCVV